MTLAASPNNRWGGVMRVLFGVAGPSRNCVPAALVCRGRPARQIHR